MPRKISEMPWNGLALDLAIGASPFAKNIARARLEHTLYFRLHQNAGAAIGTVRVALQGAFEVETVGEIEYADGPVFDPGIAEHGSNQTRFANGLVAFNINNTPKVRAVEANGTVFTDLHPINPNDYGVIGIFIDSNGVFTTKIAEVDQDTAQGYTSAKAALDNFKTNIVPPTEVFGPLTLNQPLVAKILIKANGDGWVANTDNVASGNAEFTAFIPELPFTDVGIYSLTTPNKTEFVGFTNVSSDKGFSYYRVAVLEASNALVDLDGFRFFKNGLLT